MELKGVCLKLLKPEIYQLNGGMYDGCSIEVGESKRLI